MIMLYIHCRSYTCNECLLYFSPPLRKVDREKGFEIFSRLSYDGEGQRIRTIEEILTQDSKTYYENILLFSDVKENFFILKKRIINRNFFSFLCVCSESALPYPIRGPRTNGVH